ncbi:MAG: chromosomal replication initiator protein DnaA [Clostridia bacterium]|nr:chromosomal replication initiator protein DnaA [Clostridia bacterium]
MDGQEIVDKMHEALINELPSITYTAFLSYLKFESMEGNHITFKVDYTYEKTQTEARYSKVILAALKFVTNRDLEFSIHALENSSKSPEVISSQTVEKDKNIEEEIDYSKYSLNPKYTFDTFVVGNNNNLAHAAALAVADNPAKTYNPLFIYGGVGLGKTHLMQAIGNRILSNNRNMNVVYVTSENFTNQLIISIKDLKNDPFRNKYRNADVLIIDDIQFIAKKERVQEEFFHTFNTLYENGKQIIISSDKQPKDIQFLEERLKSRFEWGLLADISNPDYETRVAILRKKAQDERIIIDNEILADIAAKIDSNIRELEGVFNKIVARASLTHIPITIELAENVINEFISKKEKVISSDFIQDVVAKYFSIDKKDLAGNKRSNDVARPRQIAMYLCREVANMTFPQIGIDFGNRDHSTVMHAYKKIEKDVKENTNTKLIVDSVKNIILNNE